MADSLACFLVYSHLAQASLVMGLNLTHGNIWEIVSKGTSKSNVGC